MIMVISGKKLTIEEFFNLPEGDRPYELIDGQAIIKMQYKLMLEENLDDYIENFESYGDTSHCEEEE